MRKWTISALIAAGTIGLAAWVTERLTRPKTPAEVAIRKAVRKMNVQEREVFVQWLAIPDRPDVSAYLIGLQSRYGRGLVRRASETFDQIRAGVGVSHPELQAAARRILRIEELP